MDQKEAIRLQEIRDIYSIIALGAYQREAKEYEAALASLREAATMDEDGPGTGPGMAVHYHTGRTLFAMGRYREAIETYERGIPKQPDYAWVFYEIARCHEALGDRENTVRYLYRFTTRVPPREGVTESELAMLKKHDVSWRGRVRPD